MRCSRTLTPSLKPRRKRSPSCRPALRGTVLGRFRSVAARCVFLCFSFWGFPGFLLRFPWGLMCGITFWRWVGVSCHFSVQLWLRAFNDMPWSVDDGLVQYVLLKKKVWHCSDGGRTCCDEFARGRHRRLSIQPPSRVSRVSVQRLDLRHSRDSGRTCCNQFARGLLSRHVALAA